MNNLSTKFDDLSHQPRISVAKTGNSAWTNVEKLESSFTQRSLSRVHLHKLKEAKRRYPLKISSQTTLYWIMISKPFEPCILE